MKPSTRLLGIVIALFASLASGTARAGHRPPPSTDKTLSPYFFVEGGDPAVDRLPLKDTRVEVSIAGIIADVTVRQIYENRGRRPIHARYVFPASTRAAVHGMTMTVGDKRIVAKIEERERASHDFERAKKEGKSASLLEESRPNVFSMELANVLPGDTIAVELKYTELLVSTEGVYEFLYPTVVGPRYSSKSEAGASQADKFVSSPYMHQGELPKAELHLTARLATGVPIQELVCPSHQVVSRPGGLGRAEVALADSERFSQDRDFILRYRLSGQKIDAGLLLYQGKDENFFLLMAEPPRAVVTDDLPPREYIFVLDVSGSMNGFPIDTAKKLMGDLVDVLRPTDTFNILVFADGSRMFAPESVEATLPNLVRALQFIGPKEGGGGTELLAAIKKGLALPRRPNVSRTVVLLTDGYIDAEKDVFGYVRSHLDQANLFAFGIGSSVNRHLIEGVARAGQGEPFVVTGPDEAPEAAAKFRRYIDSPVLTGISVKFAGFDAYDVEPKTIPDLFALRPVVVFGKWRGAAGGTIELSGKTARDVHRISIPVGASTPLDEHRALRHLWARTRVANLSDFAGPENDPDATAQIQSLGMKYSLLTPYTSFLAVQQIVRSTPGGAESVEQPLALPLGVTDLAVGEGVRSGAEPELLFIGATLLLLMLGFARLERRSTSGSPS